MVASERATSSLYSFSGQFEEASSAARVLRRRNFELEIVQLWIEKGEHLRVRKENIDIVAFTMVDLQHHGRTAASDQESMMICSELT